MSLRVLLIDDSENYVRLAHKFLRRYEYATNCDLTNDCWTCPHRRGCQLKHAHNWSEASQIIPQLAISKHSSQPADIAEEIQVSYI